MQQTTAVEEARQDALPKIKTVAVLPISYSGGTETAVKTADETVMALLSGAGYAVVPKAVTQKYWNELSTPARHVLPFDVSDLGLQPLDVSDQAVPDLPSPSHMLVLGRTMGVDLVFAARASWHTRSIWVSLGPKTKATCTVDMVIIDVGKAEVVLDARRVSADSHKRETTAETAAALLIHLGFTAVSGGPKTPHQQKSARMAIGEAMEPWLQAVMRPAPRKIEGDGRARP
ncbi:MAG: hypothetical protein IH945_01455 [Armatimonadetes bacterium]|nr:hypothetical protein [Armatimonadota bacterium]